MVVTVVIVRALFLPEDGRSIFSRNVVAHLPHCTVLTEDFMNLHCGKNLKSYVTNLTLKFWWEWPFGMFVIVC
jgi:hypothetical protein